MLHAAERPFVDTLVDRVLGGGKLESDSEPVHVESDMAREVRESRSPASKLVLLLKR